MHNPDHNFCNYKGYRTESHDIHSRNAHTAHLSCEFNSGMNQGLLSGEQSYDIHSRNAHPARLSWEFYSEMNQGSMPGEQSHGIHSSNARAHTHHSPLPGE